MTARLLLAVAAFRHRYPYPRATVAMRTFARAAVASWLRCLVAVGSTLCLANALLILAGFGNSWIVSLCVLGAVCDSVAFLLWVGEG